MDKGAAAGKQVWSAESYDKNARFVSELGAAVFEWLAPQPGERILDLGCGDGALTLKLMEAGAQVVGADASHPSSMRPGAPASMPESWTVMN